MTLDQLLAEPICFGGRTPEGGWMPGLMIILPLAAIAVLYAVGAVQLLRRAARGRKARLCDGLLFGSGWTLLALALLSPLHPLGERLFTAHMIEHELLMAGAAPLLAASRPLAALLWGLPLFWRKRLVQVGHAPLLACSWNFLSRPLIATLLHGAAIWLWHIPALFEAALTTGVLHYLQHASFFGSGLLFWWVLLPRPGQQRAHGMAVMHLFFTALHTGLLGALLALAPRLWYPANANVGMRWGLTPLEDQQLAGLVMWVPAGLVYAGAALLLAGLWIRSSSMMMRQGGAHAFKHA
jgi:putative membrane protein